MPDDLRRETSISLAAVGAGLQIVMSGTGMADVVLKGERDLVTATDVAVEDSLRSALEAAGVPVVGEERGGEAPATGAYWLVDPICGTRNFASGTPLYCVNAALVEDGEVTVAVVGDPSTDELLYAERGNGAWAIRSGRPRQLAVGIETETIIIDDARSQGDRREHSARFTADVIRADRWDMRSFGSTLALPYVATARVSAYAVFRVPGLHGAPGSLLVSEAGGVTSDIDGGRWTVESDTMLAAASESLHEQLLAIAHATRP